MTALSCIITFTAPALGDTLTFVAQWDPTLSATNRSWFFANNWWIDNGTGLTPAGRVPQANETAIVTGTVDTGMTSVRVYRLVLTNAATVMNGTFAAEYLEMQSGSVFQNAHVNVLTFALVGGTNCTLDGATLNILSIASAELRPQEPTTAATLNLDHGALLSNSGLLSLTDGSEIITLGAPQSTLAIQQGAVLASRNFTWIHGSASSPLAIDNSGVVRADGGRLTFTDTIEWRSSAYSGEFRAADTNAELLFASPLQVPPNVTNLFTGPGSSRLQAGATIDGNAEVGLNDTNTPSTDTGNLVVDENVDGSGTLHIVASSSQAASLIWNNGTLSLPNIDIDHEARMLIAGGPGTARQLSHCAIYNSGVCTLTTPDLGLEQSASINNLADGVFEVQADGTFSGSAMPTGGEFNNDGLFRKSSPDVTRFGTNNPPQGPDFNNTGTVDLRSGGLYLLAGSSSGEFRSAAGSTLWFRGGTYVLNDGAAFTGSGSVKLRQEATPATWLVTGNLAVGELELGFNGTVAGPGRTSPAMTRIAVLVASENAVLTNANLEVGSMQMQGEALVADSALVITNSVAIQGTNCSLDGSTLSIASAATAVLSANEPGATIRLNLSHGAVLEDSGSVTLQDGALITGGGLPQSRVVLHPGGILSCTNSGVIRGSVPDHLVVDSTGLFRVDGGALTFDGGIDWQSSGGLEQFEAAAATSSIVFPAGFQVPSGVTCLFSGPGTNRFVAGGRIDGLVQAGVKDQGTQAVVPANIELSGDLAGSGSLEVLSSTSQTSKCIWTQGALSLDIINIRPGSLFLVGGGASTSRQLSGCTINNSGLLVWTGQPVSAGAGTFLNVLTGGTLDIQNDGQLGFNGTPPVMVIQNYGSIVKSGGGGTNGISASLMNSGSLEIKAGTLALGQTLVQSSGQTVIDAGARLAAPAFTVQGGTVTGTGLINAPVSNNGTFAPGGPVGLLSLASATGFQQGPAGALLIRIGGANPADYSQLAVNGSAQLGGELDLQFLNGFIPEPGQSFRVLTCSSLSGAFSRINAQPLAGLVWIPRYAGTNITVTLASQLSLLAPTSLDGAFNLSFDTTPGIIYVIQATTDLAAPDWQTLDTINGDGVVRSFSEPSNQPRRFYRVLLQ